MNTSKDIFYAFSNSLWNSQLLQSKDYKQQFIILDNKLTHKIILSLLALPLIFYSYIKHYQKWLTMQINHALNIQFYGHVILLTKDADNLKWWINSNSNATLADYKVLVQFASIP